VFGRKLLSRPKRSRNEAVVPYEEEDHNGNNTKVLINFKWEILRLHAIYITLTYSATILAK
jgi:hypothetical protein